MDVAQPLSTPKLSAVYVDCVHSNMVAFEILSTLASSTVSVSDKVGIVVLLIL